MARPGGEADKLGNLYEGLWTVDAILDLFEGDFAEIVVEAVGDEGAGVEFVRVRSTGGAEYHSIKRQESRGNWTLSRLTQRDAATGRSILGDLAIKIAEG